MKHYRIEWTQQVWTKHNTRQPKTIIGLSRYKTSDDAERQIAVFQHHFPSNSYRVVLPYKKTVRHLRVAV